MVNIAIQDRTVRKVNPASTIDIIEHLAVEEPLEIVLVFSTPNGRVKKNITVTMRTPGFDEDLAIGFLFSEGIISNIQQVHAITHNRQDANQVIVTLVENEMPDLKQVNRNFYSTAACGICGKTSIDQVMSTRLKTPSKNEYTILAESLYGLPGMLSAEQDLFSRTGGLHAAAIFNFDGGLILLREDIGRHNAVDKIIGAALRGSQYKLSETLLVLSGRAGFELVQKAAVAGIGFIASIGAPSSMAVEMAEDWGITLVGFLKADRFNIYCGAQRVLISPAAVTKTQTNG